MINRAFLLLAIGSLIFAFMAVTLTRDAFLAILNALFFGLFFTCVFVFSPLLRRLFLDALDRVMIFVMGVLFFAISMLLTRGVNAYVQLTHDYVQTFNSYATELSAFLGICGIVMFIFAPGTDQKGAVTYKPQNIIIAAFICAVVTLFGSLVQLHFFGDIL